MKVTITKAGVYLVNSAMVSLQAGEVVDMEPDGSVVMIASDGEVKAMTPDVEKIRETREMAEE